MARRAPLNWSLERSRIQADRAAPLALTFEWTKDSSGRVHYFAHDAETGRLKGSVFLSGSVFVAQAVNAETHEIIRVAEFSARSGCAALRQAQAAVEAHFAAPTDLIKEAA